MNSLGYTYKIYNGGYNTEMISKQCNAGDPLETSGGLYRGHIEQHKCQAQAVSIAMWKSMKKKDYRYLKKLGLK